jgi:IS30 family transposase
MIVQTLRQSDRLTHTLYAMPRGGLRRELITCLLWSRDKRRSKTRAPDGCGHIAEMQSIHLRPPEVEDCLIPGHWEVDLIKGAMNRSSVGALAERTTLMVVLAKMPDGTAQSVLHGFSEALSAIPRELRIRPRVWMSKHAQLTERTGVAVYILRPAQPAAAQFERERQRPAAPVFAEGCRPVGLHARTAR